MSLCDLGQPDLPDTGGTCCTGAAIYGAHRCTCWIAVYDVDQAEPRYGVPQVRTGMCGDCAYRPGSPEKTEDPEMAGNPDMLEDLAAGGQPFYCHDGMRRVLARRHPAGAEIPGHHAAYDPPIRDGVPYRADGRPGLLCAGWAARARALAAELASPDDRTPR